MIYLLLLIPMITNYSKLLSDKSQNTLFPLNKFYKIAKKNYVRRKVIYKSQRKSQNILSCKTQGQHTSYHFFFFFVVKHIFVG